MNKKDFNKKKKAGEIEIIEETPEDTTSQENNNAKTEDVNFRIEDYVGILKALRVLKKTIVTAPTFTPQTFLDSIQFFDDGVDVQLWLYINGTWRYVTMT